MQQLFPHLWDIILVLPLILMVLQRKQEKVNIKRTNGVLYIKLDDEDFQQVLDMSTLDKTFHVPLTFGASLNAKGAPQRQFKGKLSNLYVEIF